MARSILSAKLLRAIGTIVVYHADVEHWLDALVYALWFHVDGARKHSGSRHMPTNLKTEIQFLRDCFANIDSLRVYKRAILEMLGNVEVAGEDRHHIVHGYVRKWDRVNRTVEFSRIWKPSGKDVEGIHVKFTEGGLFERAKQLQALSGAVEELSFSVHKQIISKEHR